MSEYDGLIADARAKIDACDLLDAWDLIECLADALEAATGGQHYAEVGRLRVRVAELEADHTDSEKGLIDTVHALAGERDSLSKLHKVTTEQTIQLAAVIEKAKAWMSDNARMQTELDLILGSADAAAVLRERDAEKWEEGRRAWARYELASEDAAAAGQWHLVPQPPNPYRITEGSNDHAGHEFCDPRLGCVLIEGSNDQ